MMYVDFMKNFLLADSSELMAFLDSYFLDMMYVDFLLADSNELMALRVIAASRAQKRLIPTF